MLAALLIAGAAPAAGPPPSPAKWVVKWEAARCTLTRSGEENGGTMLQIEYVPAGDDVDLLVANPAWDHDLVPRSRRGTLRLIGGEAVAGWVQPLEWSGLAGRGVGFHGREPRLLDRLAASSSLSIEADGREIVALRYSGAAGALPELRRCADDLLRGWGIDPAALKSLLKRPEPVGHQWNWAGEDDYPELPLVRLEGGRTTVRFTVGLDGRAHDCAVVAGSGSKALDKRGCELVLKRARYKPAIGPDGTTVAAPVVLQFRWIPVTE